MVKKTLKFTDYNGQENEKTVYFDIDEVEMAELEATYPGGFQNAMRDYLDEPTAAKGYAIFAALVKKGFCIIREDGTADKSDEAFNRFRNSKAYNALFCEVILSEKAAEAFFKSMINAPVLEAAAAKNANTNND